MPRKRLDRKMNRRGHRDILYGATVICKFHRAILADIPKGRPSPVACPLLCCCCRRPCVNERVALEVPRSEIDTLQRPVEQDCCREHCEDPAIIGSNLLRGERRHLCQTRTHAPRPLLRTSARAGHHSFSEVKQHRHATFPGRWFRRQPVAGTSIAVS